MILEEETFRGFGYISSECKPQSAKKILAACDDCGNVRAIQKRQYRALCPSCSRKGDRNRLWGKHQSEETRRKISESLMGRPSLNKGHHPSEETRKKLSEAKKGENHPNYGKHRSEETKKKMRDASKKRFEKEEERDKMREARKHQKCPKHHTKPEKIWQEIAIGKHSLPFKYTGDSSFWIGKKGGEQHNPDFVIKVNGKRYVVEIDGGYWHSPLLNHRLNERRTVTYRKKFYKKHGWHPIFIWDTDLLREDAEAFVLNLLKNEGVIK